MKSLPQSRLVLNLLRQLILASQLVQFMLQNDNALLLQLVDLCRAILFPVAEIGRGKGTKRTASPDGGLNSRVEASVDNTTFFSVTLLFRPLWIRNSLLLSRLWRKRLPGCHESGSHPDSTGS